MLKFFCILKVISRKIFISSFCLPFMVFGTTINWSGLMIGNIYFDKALHWKKDKFGQNYHLMLKPEIQIADGLRIIGSLDFNPHFEENSSLPDSMMDRQSATVLKDTVLAVPDHSSLSMNFSITQLYLDIESEFFRSTIGVAPYHFGLGLTYNDRKSSLDHWVSTSKQASVYLEYLDYYLRSTMFIRGEAGIALTSQIGLMKTKWKLEGLYRYDLELSNHLAEAYAEYLQDNWDVKLSGTYGFKDELIFGLAFEGGLNLKTITSSRLKVKAGMASKNFSFHPNYELALMFQNRLVSFYKASWQREKPVRDMIYFAPSWQASFELKKTRTINIEPSFLVAWFLTDKKATYEFDLRVSTLLRKSISTSLIAGVDYQNQEVNYLVLGQAAVTF